MTSTGNSVGMEAREAGRNAPKPLPLEALERLKELRPLLLKVERSSEPSDWSGIRTVTTNWYRNPEGREAVAIIDDFLSSYEAQGERLREVEGANTALVTALAPFAAIGADYPTGGLGADIQARAPVLMRRIVASDYYRADKTVRRAAALTQPPAMENGE